MLDWQIHITIRPPLLSRETKEFETGRRRRLTQILFKSSLEKEGNKRATPWRMLEHPWMLDMKTKRVDMQQFLRTVWDWQEDQQPALTTAEGVNLQEGGAAAAAGITSEPPGNAKVVAAAAAGETVT